MAATVVYSATVNLEPLTKNNYKYWSFRVKTYLLAEDLWDLVEGSDEEGEVEFKAWRKNNARALQAITILCGKRAESFIVYIEKARDAWNTLAEKFKPPEILKQPEPAGLLEEFSQGVDSPERDAAYDDVYESFFKDVYENRWDEVKEFIKQHPEAVRIPIKKEAVRENVENVDDGGIALHIAIKHKKVDGVKALLPLMTEEDLEIADSYKDAALAAALRPRNDNIGDETNYEIVKCIVEKIQKNKKVLLVPGDKIIPVLLALIWDRPKKICECVYSATPIQELEPMDAAELVSACLRKKYLDIALDLLHHNPKWAIAKDHSNEYPFNELVGKRADLSFSNGSEFGLWKRLIYSCIHIPEFRRIHTDDGEAVSIDCPKEDSDQGNRKHFIRKGTCFFGRHVANLRHLSGFDGLYQMKLLHERAKKILDNMSLLDIGHDHMRRKSFEKALFQAVERGHALFIKKIIIDNYRYPRSAKWLLEITNAQNKTVFEFAAEQRQDKICDLINDSWEKKEIIGRTDKSGNNWLHVAGKLSPLTLTKIDHIRSAALQMQYELQWFKKFERMASVEDLNCVNSDGLTPREVFTTSHKELVNKGESSMKETATSSSALVAALVITIMFAAAVTVPGGIDGSTGIPIYLHNKAFKTFIVADIISLCSSTTSVMVFLGILTSRFAEEDFLTSLPTKLIVGFFTLFLSIGAMMVAFSSAIFIMLPKSPSIVIPSIVLAGVPIASFIWMQFPFLLEIIVSTYGFRIGSIYFSIRMRIESIYFGIQKRIGSIYVSIRGRIQRIF